MKSDYYSYKNKVISVIILFYCVQAVFISENLFYYTDKFSENIILSMMQTIVRSSVDFRFFFKYIEFCAFCFRENILVKFPINLLVYAGLYVVLIFFSKFVSITNS